MIFISLTWATHFQQSQPLAIITFSPLLTLQAPTLGQFSVFSRTLNFLIYHPSRMFTSSFSSDSWSIVLIPILQTHFHSHVPVILHGTYLSGKTQINTAVPLDRIAEDTQHCQLLHFSTNFLGRSLIAVQQPHSLKWLFHTSLFYFHYFHLFCLSWWPGLMLYWENKSSRTGVTSFPHQSKPSLYPSFCFTVSLSASSKASLSLP